MKADGSVVIKADLDVDQAEKDLAKLKKSIHETEDDIEDLTAKKSKAEETALFSGAELDAEKEKLAQMKSELKEIRALAKDTTLGSVQEEAKAAIPGKQEDIADQSTRVRMLQAEYNKVSNEVDRYSRQIEAATQKLDRQKEEAGELVDEINSVSRAVKAMKNAQEKAEKSMARFSRRMSEVVRSALVFTIITQSLAKFREWFGKVIKTNDEAQKSFAQLKGALLTLAQPLVEVLLPALVALVNILTRMINVISGFVSAVFGKTADQSREAAKALNEQVEAMDGVGGAAKKAGKSLAGFDEINKLSGDSGAGGGSAGAEIKPDFSGIRGAMAEMEVYMSGALLALGAILAFAVPGQLPLGIGLMAAGAMGLASALAVDWDTMPANLKSAIAKTMLLLGGAALVIGMILGFSGVNVPLGMGLIMAGAGALGVAAASLDWDSIITALKGSMGPVVSLLSGTLLAIGAILAFCGYMPLGIGLMVAGAVGLAATAVLNWDSIVEALRGPVGGVTALVSGALLAIGAVLAFSGSNLPLGIGLMAAGAIGLASVIALNWDFITEMMRGKVGVITAIASGALLVLGLILLFTGVGTGLGIGLILAGAAGLATVVAFNWNFLSDKVKEIWGNIKSFWNEHIAQVFTKEWWLNLAKKCGNGLISGFEKAINGIIGMFETMINWIVDKLNTIKFDVPDWVPLIGGKEFGFNIPNVKFGRVSIPRLAQGAVIPPNREFMAVLGDQKSGTNIETPLATMVQAFKQAMAETGGGGAQTIILQIDGREFGRAVKKYGGTETQRVGVSLVGVRG